MFFKGWFLIESASFTPKDVSYLLHDPIKNVYASVSLPLTKKLGGKDEFKEDQWVRVKFWAQCNELYDDYRYFICNVDEKRFEEMSCSPYEGIWINGVQYC
jgi:hypothetical protein